MQDAAQIHTSGTDTSPHSHIASDRVESTPVYNSDGEKLGTISRFMVGKRSGKVDYVVMSFGGLFGLGQEHYPLPWNILEYDPARGGYVVDIDPKILAGGPRYSSEGEPVYDERYGRSIYDYYGVPWTL